MNAVHGIVSTHAQTMRCAMPQRTAESLWTAPTPTIAPVIVCVVDTGMPSPVAANSVIAPPVSAQKPPTGFNLVILMPIVFTIRQPPASVPSAIAAWQAITTQNGTWNVGPDIPAANSSIAMMPIVFCASLPPWPRLYSDADTSCSRRNQRSTRWGVVRNNIQATVVISSMPSRKPNNGLATIATLIVKNPGPTSVWMPPFATAAP